MRVAPTPNSTEMPTAPLKKGPPNRKKKTRKLERQTGPRTRKQKILRVLKWAGLASLVGLALASLLVAILFWHYGRDLPSVAKLADYHPKQVIRIEDRKKDVIGEVYTERRTFVPYKDIPPLLVHAVLSAEDANFFHHEGIDYLGMIRALFVNVRSGKKKQGASTITQQVVKTFLLTPERTLKRKFQEIILARRLEKTLTKEQILTLYLNQIYLGGGRYGMVEAAKYYFGKDDLKKLTIGEAALLAGLPQSPEHLNPKKPRNADAAKNRQIYVLREMVKNKYISREDADTWAREPIRVVADPYPQLGMGPEWVEIARHELVDQVGEDKVDRMGGEVVTTMDPDMQAMATRALQEGLRALDHRHHYGGVHRKIAGDKIDLEVARLARKLPKKGPEAGELYDAVVLSVDDAARELVVDLGKWKASLLLGGHDDERFNPDGKKPSERFARGDMVRVRLTKHHDDDRKTAEAHVVALEPAPEGAVVVLDPHTREVLALVGGYDTPPGGYDRATMAKRQPGSTFKPFVYAAAIDTGDYTPASIVNDSPEVYDLWKPQNYEKDEHLGPVRLREALAKSINTVAIKVIHDIGPDRVAAEAHALGIKSDLPEQLSLALGSGEVTPIELTNAFATIAAGGRYAPPKFIERIGDTVTPPVQSQEVMRPEVAYVVTDMMRSVVEEGTGRRVSKLKLDVAGKTGTSNDLRDCWFIGMTPDLVVGVWVGFDEPRSLGHGEQGGRTAAPVYINLMEALRQKQPMRAKPFPRPTGVVQARIDKASGKLAADGSTPDSSYDEVFVDGTVPTEKATAPGQVDADTYVLDAYDDAYDGDDQPAESGKDKAPAPAPGKTAPPPSGAAKKSMP